MRAQDEMQRVVEEYSSSLLRAAYSLLKNREDSEDAVQETFLRYMEKAPVFTSQEHEKAWLLRVAVNISKNHLSSAWFRKRTDLKEDIPALEQEEQEVLESVLKLPAKYRTVIHLYYYEGYSLSEISQILRSPLSTVTTRLSRARKKLAILLKEDDPK
ncbi:MAG: RNA polymerase sigma factor [Hydrogeniiclostridium sp.]